MFEELKGNGRIWIYFSKRPLAAEESQAIQQKMDDFCSGWAAHGSALRSQFEIHFDQLLILGVDEHFEEASGCSIDSSVQMFREIDQEYQLDLFNRMNLAFLEGNKVQNIPVSELNSAYEQGQLNPESILLDNSISTLDQLRNRWKIPFKESWAFKRIKHPA